MTTPIRETMTQEVAEGGSALLTFTLTTELGVPVTLAQLGTLTLTLYNRADEVIINLKDETNIKNTNGGTVAATSGACTLALEPDDNPIVDATRRIETHVALIRGTYNGGAGVVSKEIMFRVRNLGLTP